LRRPLKVQNWQRNSEGETVVIVLRLIEPFKTGISNIAFMTEP
jgi:hypothetical protein